MGRNKEQSARMLDHLVVSAPRLIKPYVQPILKVLVPKLREPEPYPGVVISILTAIGDLAEVIHFPRFIDELVLYSGVFDLFFFSSLYFKRCGGNLQKSNFM